MYNSLDHNIRGTVRNALAILLRRVTASRQTANTESLYSLLFAFPQCILWSDEADYIRISTVNRLIRRRLERWHKKDIMGLWEDVRSAVNRKREVNGPRKEQNQVAHRYARATHLLYQGSIR